MTLVWLAATLTVIVAGAVFAVWTVRIHTIRSGRLIQLHRQRMHADIAGDGDDRRSRDAWAAHLAETSVRHGALDDALAAQAGVGRLVGLLTSIEVEETLDGLVTDSLVEVIA